MKGILSGLFITVVSGVFFLVGLLIAWKCFQLYRRGVRTIATVVDFIEASDTDSASSRYSVVEFVDLAGDTHRVKLSVTGRDRLGDRTTVIYDPDNPTSLTGTSFVQFWLFPVVFTLIGAGGIAVGIAVMGGVLHTE